MTTFTSSSVNSWIWNRSQTSTLHINDPFHVMGDSYTNNIFVNLRFTIFVNLGLFLAFWDSYKYKNMDKITQILENVVRCKYFEASVRIKNPIKNSYQDGLDRTTQTLDNVVVIHILIWDRRKTQLTNIVIRAFIVHSQLKLVSFRDAYMDTLIVYSRLSNSRDGEIDHTLVKTTTNMYIKPLLKFVSYNIELTPCSSSCVQWKVKLWHVMWPCNTSLWLF